MAPPGGKTSISFGGYEEPAPPKRQQAPAAAAAPTSPAKAAMAAPGGSPIAAGARVVQVSCSSYYGYGDRYLWLLWLR